MPYYDSETIERARQVDLLTYLQTCEPQELVHVSGNVYCTKTHDSLRISNGKWCWFSRGIGGYSALDYLIKVITLRAPGRENGRKLCRNLGEEYSLESIRRRILAQSHPQRTHRPKPQRCRLHGDLKQARKVTGFRALYFHYCYLLGVFPQKQNRQPRRVSHACREDLIRAKELTDEARLLSRHRIDTLEQLNAYRSDVESQLAGLTEQRKSLYRKLRTKAVLADPARQEHIRAEISKLSAQIKELRREVKLCEDIALRSTSIKDKIQAAREEVSGKDEKARQEPEQGRAAPPGRR